MNRICSTCKEPKPLKDFHKNGVDKFGVPAFRADCKKCYRITRKVEIRKFLGNTKHRTGETGTLALRDWRDALVHFGGACAYCGRPASRRLRLTKGHVIPVVQGGTTTRRNIIPACSRCNCSKSDSDYQGWFKRQVFYTVGRLERIEVWIHGYDNSTV